MIDIRNPRLEDFARAGGLTPVASGNILERICWIVQQYREAPFRSSDWIAGEVMNLADTMPAVTDEELADLFADAMDRIHDMDTGINDFAKACVKALRPEVQE